MDLPCTSGRPAMYLARDHAAGAGRRGRRRGRGRRVHRRSMPGTRQAGARDTAGLREVHGGWPDGAPFPVASLTWSPCMDHHATPPGAATTAGTGGYPDGPLDALDAADAAFRLLAAGPRPLAVHASHLAEGLPDRPVPLGELRVLLLHPARSEEHTSELQSRPHLVCRLLLEKKKKKI